MEISVLHVAHVSGQKGWKVRCNARENEFLKKAYSECQNKAKYVHVGSFSAVVCSWFTYRKLHNKLQ